MHDNDLNVSTSAPVVGRGLLGIREVVCVTKLFCQKVVGCYASMASRYPFET